MKENVLQYYSSKFNNEKVIRLKADIIVFCFCII